MNYGNEIIELQERVYMLENQIVELLEVVIDQNRFINSGDWAPPNVDKLKEMLIKYKLSL